MAINGFNKVVYRAVTTAAFKLFRTIFLGLQNIYWELNGTAARIREARDPLNYERSAQVVDVFLFHTFCELQSTTINDFVYTHNRFDSPQYVIDNDHVTLMAVDEQNAIFVEAKEKHMQLWRSEYSSFMRLAQMEYHKRLIIIPLNAFHRMSDVIGDPKGELIFLLNIGRCGSTLLTQVMECTDRCVSVSEPGAPDRAIVMYRKKGDSPEMRQLVRDVIRWECRPLKAFQPAPLAYMLKLIVPTGLSLPMLRELFPKSRALFMYRDLIKVSKSFYRLSFQWPTMCLLYMLGQLSGSLCAAAIENMGFHGGEYNHRLEDGLTFGVLLSAVSMRAYLDMRRDGIPISAVRYEELVGKPLETCRRLMEYCGLPVELAERAVRGLETDSQRNTPLSMAALRSLPDVQLTEKSKQSLNQLLTKFDLPLIGGDYVLDGTLMVNA